MKWHQIVEATPQNRTRANALFNQAFASRVVPQHAKAMTYIDVHTEASGASGEDEGPVYRVFRTGAIDVGTPDGQEKPTVLKQSFTTQFFVTMCVEIRVGIGRTEKQDFAKVMEAIPGDTIEDLHWRAWLAMAKEHKFDSNTAEIVSWDAKPYGPLLPVPKCGMPECRNPARADDDFCDGHAS